jgi:predicted aconitase
MDANHTDYVAASAAANQLIAEIDAAAPAYSNQVIGTRTERRSRFQSMGRMVAGRIVADRRGGTDRRAAIATVGSFCWGG